MAIADDLLRAVKDRAAADAGYATAVQGLAGDLERAGLDLQTERARSVDLAARLATAEAALAAAGTGQAPGGRHTPARGAYLGLFAPSTDLGHQLEQVQWDPAVVHRFAGTRDRAGTPEKTAIKAGRVPLLTWQTATGWPTANDPPVTLDRILGGDVDDMIDRQATTLAALGGPCFLRWNHEMNLSVPEYTWTGIRSSTPGNIVRDGPAKYAEAYRRVHDLIERAGAVNVAHVWCPGVQSNPDEAWNHWLRYYPGDDVVDWVGCDGYCRTADVTAEAKFGGFLRGAPAGKPVMICETSSYPQFRGAWLAGLTRLAKTYPRLRAVVLFSIDKGDGAWKLTHDDTEVAALRAMVADPVFAGRPA